MLRPIQGWSARRAWEPFPCTLHPLFHLILPTSAQSPLGTFQGTRLARVWPRSRGTPQEWLSVHWRPWLEALMNEEQSTILIHIWDLKPCIFMNTISSCLNLKFGVDCFELLCSSVFSALGTMLEEWEGWSAGM